MKLLRTTSFLLLTVIVCTAYQHALADVYASFVRVTQENSTAPFDGNFNDGTGAAIRFILSDHADSVLVRIKSAGTVIRTIKGVNFSIGDSSVIWNGKNDAGANVASGTYSIQIVTYDKGYSTYTEISYPDAGGLSMRGMTAMKNPAFKNFGSIYTVDNGGFQGVTGASRFASNGTPWGDVKGSAKLTTTGIALGPSEARWSAQADNDGYVYVIGRTARQLLRFHTDSLNVIMADSGFGGYYANGIAIREETGGKTIALTVNDASATATISGNSKILAFRLNSASATHLGGSYDTLVTSSGKFNFWDAVFGRDSVLYATFIYPADAGRSGIAKFNLAGKTHPLTMADTSWTVRVDSGRVSTCTIFFGSQSDGSKDVLYFVNARLASGNPPLPIIQGIYAVTGLNASNPTRSVAYADKQNNASITRSDIATDAVGNIVYFENSNEEISIISPPTGSNSYTYDSPTSIYVFTNVISIALARLDANKDYVPDRLNDTVSVIGVVNGINTTASANRFQYTIQDEQAGIVITKGSQTGGGPVYQVGDRLYVRGAVIQFSGTAELDIAGDLATNVQLLDKGNTLTPIPLTIAQRLADAEKYESMLIKINYLKKTSGTWPATSANATLTMTDGYDSLALFIDLDTDIDQTAEAVYPVNVVGIATQFSSVVPPNTGYQISPRYRSDFTESVAAAPNAHFALLEPAHNSTVTLNSGAQTTTFRWRSAVDLNGDALIYQWAPIGFTAVATANAAKDTFLVRTGTQLLTYLGTKDTVNLRWTALAKDPANPIVANVDTFTVKVIRGAIVSVSDVNGLPRTFELEQNYPNPFNPNTTIRFGLPTTSQVRLTVYNMLGQEVVTLIDGIQDAGYINAIWDGKNRLAQQVATGMYIYRIEAKSIFSNDGLVSNKKMLLLK